MIYLGYRDKSLANIDTPLADVVIAGYGCWCEWFAVFVGGFSFRSRKYRHNRRELMLDDGF